MIFKKNTSKQVFKELTYPHMKLLYNVALKYTGNVFDAEDIVQETYLMAFNKFHQLKEPSKCKPWLLRILRNNFLKTCQKNKNQQRLSETDYIEFLKNHIKPKDADEILVNKSQIKTLKTAIEQLPLKYREVLTLYYMDEMLYKDIAKALDIPIGTVMSRLTRARQGMKINLLKQMTHNRKNIVDINFKRQWPKKTTQKE
jgi:RNA polymerase sigma-70 factor (ECF subfamily)